MLETSNIPHQEQGPLYKAFFGGPQRSTSKHGKAPKETVSGLAALLAATASTSVGSDTSKVPVWTVAKKSQEPVLKPGFSSAALLVVQRTVRVLLSTTHADAPASLETVYQSVDTLVNVAGDANDLYERVELELERRIGEVARSLRASPSLDLASTSGQNQSRNSGESWLQQLSDAFSKWCEGIALVCNVLLPLDRFYAASGKTESPIWDLSLDLFKRRIVEDETLQLRAISSMTVAVDADRQAPGQYRSLHSALLAMLASLDAYRPFAEALHGATRDYYGQYANANLHSFTTTEYLRNAHNLVEHEKDRTSWCFTDVSDRLENIEITYKELIGDHVVNLSNGLDDILESRKFSDLSTVFSLFSSVHALSAVRSAFERYIVTAGEAIVMDKARDDEMIQRLLEFKAAIDGIVAGCFNGHLDFAASQKSAFEKFINKRENKPPELIAKYLDAKLKSGNRTMNDQQLEQCMNEALVLFRFTRDKDMFEEFYKRAFAKRLLLNKSASSDAEQSMLLKLKEECGAGFTIKLETMLKDITLSDEIMKGYSVVADRAAAEGKGDPFDLSAHVITQAHWPPYPQIDITLPVTMARALDRFSTFYKGRNSGRRLEWTHSLGTHVLTATFPKAGEKELHVSTFQTIILLLFNDVDSGDSLSYSEIKEQTGLEEVSLKRTLQSLACGQIPTRVLRKIPQGKEVEDGDRFVFNEGFKNDRIHIRINQIQMKETAEEQKQTEQRVLIDRDLVLQAATVRIMKARKQMKHAELVNEVVDQIKNRFAIEASDLKKTFEILIEKDYMERVEGERSTYRYLA